MAVVVFMFLKHNRMSERLADSNYFYIEINTVREFSCMHNHVFVHVTCTIVIMHAICKGRLFVVQPVIKLQVTGQTKDIGLIKLSYH